MRPRGCLEALLIDANERRGLQRVAHMVKKRGRVSKLVPIIQRLLSKLLSPRSYFNVVTTVARFLLNAFENGSYARRAGFILPRGASCEGGEGIAWRQCVRSRSDVAAVIGGWPTSSTRFELDR